MFQSYESFTNIFAQWPTKQTNLEVLRAIGTNPADSDLLSLIRARAPMSASETNMRKRVMVADDDPAVRESLKKVLEDTGYEVLLAEDGEAAVKGLTNESIDLLLLDLQMPKLDGWDVFEGARSRCSLLPVIMMTGLATQLETRLIPGLDALLEKPIEAAVLLKIIQELLCESPSRRVEKLDSKLLSSRGLSKSAPGYLTFVPSDRPGHG